MTLLQKLALYFCFTFTVGGVVGQQSHSFYLQSSDVKGVEEFALHSLVRSVRCPFLLEEMKSTYIVELTQSMTLDELKSAMGSFQNYTVLEPVPKYTLLYTPNDIQAQQYHLNLINAAQAWDINFSSSPIIIAITDDAVDLTHPDLAANIWMNPGEIPNNGIDDDGNSFIDDTYGWDFGDGDNNPAPNTAATNHGTHVAGIAAASTDNGTGIASISVNAKIMAIKMSQTGSTGLYSTAETIDYAIAMGSDVINMSWGGGSYSQIMQNLFNIAYAQNIICVAAAGNSNMGTAFYPAKYDHVIAVASTDQNDQKSGFSNFGLGVDLAAPGSDIYSTIPLSQYTTMSGTSMASPLVSGLAALMKAANPLASVNEILDCLVNTCDPVNGAYANQLGGGRINAYEALSCITSPTAAFNSNYTQICPGNQVQFNNYSTGTGLSFLWSFPGGTPNTSTAQNPLITYNTPGIYDVSLTITNGTSSMTTTESNYISVDQPTATISGLSNIYSGSYGSVIVNFSGNGPFNLTISDGTNQFPITGITNNPYVHFFNPSASTDYTISAFSDTQCSGTFSGTATINVVSSTGGLCNTSTVSMIKYLGTTFNDVSSAVVDLGVYGYLVVGAKNIGASSLRSYICRLDNCGNIIWEKTYNELKYNYAVSAELDGAEILVGLYSSSTTTSNSSRNGLLRLDLNGNVISMKEIIPSSLTMYPRKFFKTNSGDYVFAGVTNELAGTFGGNDGFLVKCDANGTILWRNRYGGANNEFCHNAIEDSNGDFVSVGYQRDYFSFWSGYVAKHDASGNLLWMKRYDINGTTTRFTHLTEVNGSYYISGDVSNGSLGGTDAVFLKLDGNGNILWQKYIGGSTYDGGGGIDHLNDTIYFQAMISAGASSVENAIFRFTTAGNLIDFGAFGTASDENINGLGCPLKITSTGAVIGINHSNGSYLGGNDIFFFRYNTFSDLCDSTDISPQIVNANLQATPFNASSNSPSWTFSNTSFTSQDVISNQGFACINTNYIDSCELIADFNYSGVYCPGDSLIFTNNSSAITGNPSLAIWDFGDGSAPVFTSNTTLSHLYQNSGNYLVTLIVIDTLLGCSDTTTQQISLVPQPTINLIDTLLVCPGEFVTVSALVDCFSNQAIFDWYDDSIIAYENGPSVTINAFTSQFLYLQIIDGTNSYLDSIFISINPNCCSSEAIIELAQGLTCVDGEISISHASAVIGTSPIFNWQFLPDGNPLSFNGANPPMVSFPSSGVKQIILELIDDCGVFYDTVEIVIAPKPTFELGPSMVICVEDSIQFGESPVAGFNYSWQPSAIFNDPSIANPIGFVSAPTMVNVHVIDTWTGCETTDSVLINLEDITFDILLSDTVFCGNEIHVPFMNNSNADVQWSPATVITETYGNDSIAVFISSPTTLIGTVTSSSGFCTASDTVILTPAQVIDALVIDTIGCLDNSWNYSPPGNWTLNGTEQPNIQLWDDGVYLYDEVNACGSAIHQITLTFVPCDCSVYLPNTFTPNTDEHNQTFRVVSDCLFHDFRLEIYNRWGELIFESEDAQEAWDGSYRGKIVQQGTYTWKVQYTPNFDGIAKSLVGHISVVR